VYRLHVGGNERDLAKLARHLDPTRYQVHVACFHDTGERRAELDRAGIPVLHLPVTSFHNRSAWNGARILRHYLHRHNIQIVQAFDAPTSIYLVPLARLFGVPHVVSCHLYFRSLIASPNRQALRLVDMLAERIVVNAEAVKRHLLADYGLDAHKVFVCHNGVEIEEFFPRPEPRVTFLRDATLVVGSLCVLREEKRLDLLLKSFARVLPLDERMRLLIVGDGEMRQRWMSLGDSLGLQNHCRFEQTTTDVPAWMRQMDLFALCSASEGFPNTVLEAMACGCAVIASSVGGVPELIDDGRTGLLFDSGSVEHLTQQLRSLILNRQQRLNLARAAAEEAKAHFSMQLAARRMDQFYRSLLT
jgi:L-malate glycosyltransferase